MSKATRKRRQRQNRRRQAQRQRRAIREVMVAGEADREPVFALPKDTVPCIACRERPRQGRDEVRGLHQSRRLTFPLQPGGEVKCEVCLGLGYLVRILGKLFPATPENRRDADLFRDPYDLEMKESRDALHRLQLHRLRHG